jgi:hypothetical protein
METKHWWEDYAWRMIQTNLRQIDMLDMNAQQYVQQLQRFHATVAMINVGGILASYETSLPFHFQSPFLEGDSLGMVIDACHEANIRVIARTDFSKIRRPIYETHPDWAYRTVDGEIIDYEGDVHACICGGFQQDCAFEILREILTTFPVDGLFINMGGFQTRDYSHRSYSICHCNNCKKQFKERSGMDLPRTMDLKAKAYQAYRVFQREVLADYNSRLEAFVRGISPEVAIDGIDFFRLESNTEYQRPLPHWQYSASSNTRCLRGINELRVVSNCTVDFIGFFYRHIAVGAEQQKLRLYQSLANFGKLDYYLIGRLDNHLDRSAYTNIQEVFQYYQEHESDYRHVRSHAEVLLMREGKWSGSSEERGWIRALTENHILFDEALEGDMLNASLDRYQAIILPNIEQVSSALCAKLDRYVEQGGILVCAGQSGIYDEAFASREHPAFACLGIERIGVTRDDMVSAMFLLGTEDKIVFPSFANVDAIAFGDRLTYQVYSPEVKTYLRLLPPQPFGPPERCYGGEATAIPGVAVNSYGKGKGISIPYQIGSLYYKEGYENTFFFLQDILTSLCGIRSVAPDLSPMVEVTFGVHQSAEFALVQFVNNSGHSGTSYFKPLSIENFVVDIPMEAIVVSAQSLMDGRSIPYIQEDRRVKLQINRLNEFDCVKLILRR